VISRLPDLTRSLKEFDLGHLRIVAEMWGLELSAADLRRALEQLVTAVLDQKMVDEMLDLLPAEAMEALAALLANGGRLPWAQFTRQYGAVREMGPGRRDGEKPHLRPVSVVEMLWYRGLVNRAFFDTPDGPEEFAYLPADLIPLLPPSGGETNPPPGRPASPAERARIVLATDRILDDACTLLAALRLGLTIERFPFQNPQLQVANRSSVGFLRQLLGEVGLLDAGGLPLPEPARAFLEAPRGEALAILARAWCNSLEINELRQLPGLLFEGQWQNDPLKTRQWLLQSLPRGLPSAPAMQEPAARPVFWSLEAFVTAIKQRRPDFQRPAGDYDSWFIRSEGSGAYLRGFDHWDEVDGALIRYLICGPLHWLGIVDLAYPTPPPQPAAADPPEPAGPHAASAFRLSAWAEDLLAGRVPVGLPEETESVIVTADARLRVPRLASRAARYQLARFSVWETEENAAFRYRLTPAALERAREQGLRVSHLLGLLRKAASVVPPKLIKALERWEERGASARLERLWVLRLSSPEMLQELRASPASRFLGEPLGPAAVIVRPGAWDKVMAALAELGYLAEVEGQLD
jgi:hypothetical protein